jgi:hypothetical protein
MTAFEEIEDLKKTKDELESKISSLQIKYELLDFKHMVWKGLGMAVTNILGGLFFVFVSAYIAGMCLHYVALKYPLPSMVRDVTWVDIGCVIYFFRALTGGFIRVPTKEANG